MQTLILHYRLFLYTGIPDVPVDPVIQGIPHYKTKKKDYTGEYTFFSYIPGVNTVERFLHWWHVASRVSR